MRNPSITFFVVLLVGCAGAPIEKIGTETGSTGEPMPETSSSSTEEPEPEPEPESTEGSSGTDGANETTTDGETGSSDWTPYQACDEMRECPPEADECHVYVAHVPVHYCTVFCEDASECPNPPEGDTERSCDAYLGYSYCALDCAGAKTCPEGMGCFEVTLVDQTMVRRCGWVDG